MTILNPLLPGEAEDDKLAVLDIHARDSRERQYNVEMQLFLHRYLKERFLYYWAKLHSQQLSEGEDYENLRPTISVLLLDDVLFPELDGAHQRFQLWNDVRQQVFSDKLDIHLLELPKFQKTLTELKTELDRWLFFLQHSAELELESWPAELAAPALQHAAQELKMLSKTDADRFRYESRLKGERDYRSGMTGARLEGKLEGKLEGGIQLCQKLLGLPVATDEEIQRMGSEKASALLAELESTLLSRRSLN